MANKKPSFPRLRVARSGLLLMGACGLLLSLAGARRALAQPAEGEKTILRVSGLRGAGPESLLRGLPVRLQGTITFIETNASRLFLQDPTGNIVIKSGPNSLPGEAGQLVEVVGMSGLLDEEPAVFNPQIKVLGPGSKPRSGHTSIHHILAGHDQNNYVSVEGLVRMAFEHRGKLVLSLDQNGSRIRAEVSQFDLAKARQLVDAEVRLQGVCVWSFLPDGRRDTPRLLLANADQIAVVHPALDPATLPVISPRDIIALGPDELGRHRRRVRGVVSFYYPKWAGSAWYLFLQTGDDGLFVKLAEPTTAKPGDLVDALGYPAPGSFRSLLEDSLVVPLGPGTMPTPLLATPAILGRAAEFDTRLIAVEGELTAENAHNAVLPLSIGKAGDQGWLVKVFLAQDATQPSPGTPSPFPLHARLRATGVLSVKWLEQDQAPELQILASPGAVAMVAKPPWSRLEYLAVGVPLVVLLVMSTMLLLAQKKHIAREAGAQAALRQQERKLQESEKFAATGRMAARIAHEINNPLAGILNSFTLVKGALPPDAETQRWAGMMEREIGRIARIVRRMFELYGKQKDQPEEVRFDQLLTEVADLMRDKALRRQVSLTVSPSCPRIRGRQMAGGLIQVLYNLVSNAIEASPAGGEVELGLEQKDGHVLLTVRDHGPGIPADAREKIFEPFFSTKTGTTDAGMGLGLTVSRSLVESMAGRLDFVTVDGQGTTFVAEVPLILPDTLPT